MLMSARSSRPVIAIAALALALFVFATFRAAGMGVGSAQAVAAHCADMGGGPHPDGAPAADHGGPCGFCWLAAQPVAAAVAVPTPRSGLVEWAFFVPWRTRAERAPPDFPAKARAPPILS
ncbi:DUF2946 family protein [Nitrospirillum amazonense]|uniref:DUF2946 family protein n=1 Tax=Nitrospirillum amazonense TaxID=28077 RepID=UPI002DD42FF3|nr:DUF2946 family protein [Nitrospirillum amazonense]MEC4589645.1 DUF2946 family protein [Nitrospirillum amazonense]